MGLDSPSWSERRKKHYGMQEPKPPPPEPVYIPDVPEKTWRDVYSQAMAKGLWIYDPSRKQWFSPEEFKAFYERYISGFAKFFEQCEVRDPFEGIEAGHQRMLEVQNKLEELTKRVLQYYKDRAKPSK